MSEFIDKLDQKRLEFQNHQARWFTNACEDHALFDLSHFAKEALAFPCRVAMTPSLFRIMYPVAEDATKGIRFDERVYELFKGFHTHLSLDMIRLNLDKNERLFSFKMETYVKRKTQAHVEKDEHNSVTAVEMRTKTYSDARLVWVRALSLPGDPGEDVVVIFTSGEENLLTAQDVQGLILS